MTSKFKLGERPLAYPAKAGFRKKADPLACYNGSRRGHGEKTDGHEAVARLGDGAERRAVLHARVVLDVSVGDVPKPTNLPLAPFDGAPAVPARFVSLSAMALGGAVLLVRARRGARKTDRSARVALYGACVAAAALLVALDVADGAYDGDFAGVPFLAAFVLWGLLGALVYTEFGKTVQRAGRRALPFLRGVLHRFGGALASAASGGVVLARRVSGDDGAAVPVSFCPCSTICAEPSR